MEILMAVDDVGEFLEHYGVKGMHWGVWNAETAARYNGKKTNFKGGGGGDNEDEIEGRLPFGPTGDDDEAIDEDNRPEALYKNGELSKEDATKLRHFLDHLISLSENGQLTEQHYQERVNKEYERMGLKSPYDAAAMRKAEARDQMKEMGINPYANTRAEAQQKMVGFESNVVNKLLGLRREKDANGEQKANMLDVVNAVVKGASKDQKAVADAYMTQKRANEINNQAAAVKNAPTIQLAAAARDKRTTSDASARREAAAKNIFNRTAKAISESSMSTREKVQRDGMAAVTKVINSESSKYPVANAATTIRNTATSNRTKANIARAKQASNTAQKVKSTASQMTTKSNQPSIADQVVSSAKQAKGSVSKTTENIGWDPKTRTYKARRETYTAPNGRKISRIVNN